MCVLTVLSVCLACDLYEIALTVKDSLLSDGVPSCGVSNAYLALFLDTHLIQINRTRPDNAATLPPIKKQTS